MSKAIVAARRAPVRIATLYGARSRSDAIAMVLSVIRLARHCTMLSCGDNRVSTRSDMSWFAMLGDMVCNDDKFVSGHSISHASCPIQLFLMYPRSIGWDRAVSMELLLTLAIWSRVTVIVMTTGVVKVAQDPCSPLPLPPPRSVEDDLSLELFLGVSLLEPSESFAFGV